MATVSSNPALAENTGHTPSPPPLQSGDRLSADEFERRYDAMPQLKKAELVEGVVYVPSPVTFDDHAGPHFDLITWLGLYRIFTPGIRGGDNGTLRLDLGNRPQPDAFLIVLPSHGGQVQIDEDGYVRGAPELVAEVAATSANLDLNDKLRVYRRNGVREYIVWRVFDRAIDWFVLLEDQFVPLLPSPEGTYRSQVLPGLCLDPAALMNGQMPVLLQMMQQATASAEHKDFVARLLQQASQKQP
jgi:Uma2 family endonuclease